MTEKRLLALIALLIGLVGGLLILNQAWTEVRRISDFSTALSELVVVIIGVAILAASLLIYRSKYGSGGLLDILLGIVALILSMHQIGAILAIVAGVIGLVASQAGP